MIRSLDLFLVLSIGSLLSGLTNGQCPSSADGCINKDKFSQLSNKDPNNYCRQGAILAAEAQNCLKNCNFSEAHSYLLEQKKNINSFCQTVDSRCDAVCDTFVAQTRSFDRWGGQQKIVEDIKRQFINGDKIIDCQTFYWSRYSQKNQNCSINEKLDLYIVQQNPDIPLSLAICGSETIRILVPHLEKTDGCKADAEETIRKACNVSCDVANVKDSVTLCSLLEKQAACLEEHVTGCTALERRLVLPRLNSYAIANKYLRCSIKYLGIPVKPAGKDCLYSELLDKCMLTYTEENTLTFFQLQPLLNSDTLVIDFCSTKGNSSDQIIECRNNFITCNPVQSKLLITNDSADTSFIPEIGVFPLDHYGMKYIYDKMIPENCPKSLLWSDRICVPDSKRDEGEVTVEVRTQTTHEDESTSFRAHEDESTSVDARSTPDHGTPSRATRGSTPTKDAAGGFQRRTSTGLRKVRGGTDPAQPTGHCKANLN